MLRQINSSIINCYKHRLSSTTLSALFYSIFVHVAVFFVLLNINLTVEPSEKKVIKIISAKLFYKKELKALVVQKVKVTEHDIEQSNIKNNDVATNENRAKKESRDKKAINPLDTGKDKNINSQVNTHNKTTTPRVSALNTLQSLREKISKQNISQGAQEHYQAFVDSKNFIPRSTTKFNQLPEAKAVEIKINCNNLFNKSIKTLSSLLGGGIKCNNFNGSQKYIDARLKKMGKKKDER